MINLKKLSLLSLIVLCLNLTVQAQYVPGAFSLPDVSLLFSNTNPGGTARIQGIGGAQVSLGGDISSASGNPAGLGFFNRSIISVSPSYNIFDSESIYMSSLDSDSDTRINFANVGVVFNNTKDNAEPGAWRGGSFAISINKVNDFNGRFRYQGNNSQSSISDYLADASFGIDESDLGTEFDLIGMAFNSFLISPTGYFKQDGFSDEYIPVIYRYNTVDDIFETDQAAYQNEVIESRGGQYAWNFAYGGNFADKLYVGASLGLTNIRYELNKSFSEAIEPESELYNDPIGYDLLINELLAIDGIGINATVGFIYKPVPFLNVGASFTSPTFINIDEETSADLFVDYFGQNTGSYDIFFPVLNETQELDQANLEGDIYLSEYQITTPFKASAGATFFFGKWGFVSADFDYIEFSSQRIFSRDFETVDVNRDLKDLYRPVINMRLGGELRYNIFRLRGGYAHNPSPYDDALLSGREQNSISAGAGIRLADFFVDFAYVMTSFDSSYSPYSTSFDTPVAQFNNNFSSSIITAGFIF